MNISITDQQVFQALGDFLEAALPVGTEIVQLQDNRVPMPRGAFVGMNNDGTKRLATNVNDYVPGDDAAGVKNILTPTQYRMQIEFYGDDAAAWANTVQALFRDSFATEIFPATIQPLFADDPIQIPLIDGEAQYTQRWQLEAVMQYNPVVSVPQEFADQLQIGLKEVDTTFPPT
jgi:hypothetical protein